MKEGPRKRTRVEHKHIKASTPISPKTVLKTVEKADADDDSKKQWKIKGLDLLQQLTAAHKSNHKDLGLFVSRMSAHCLEGVSPWRSMVYAASKAGNVIYRLALKYSTPEARLAYFDLFVQPVREGSKHSVFLDLISSSTGKFFSQSLLKYSHRNQAKVFFQELGQEAKSLINSANGVETLNYAYVLSQRCKGLSLSKKDINQLIARLMLSPVALVHDQHVFEKDIRSTLANFKDNKDPELQKTFAVSIKQLRNYLTKLLDKNSHRLRIVMWMLSIYCDVVDDTLKEEIATIMFMTDDEESKFAVGEMAQHPEGLEVLTSLVGVMTARMKRRMLSAFKRYNRLPNLPFSAAGSAFLARYLMTLDDSKVALEVLTPFLSCCGTPDDCLLRRILFHEWGHQFLLFILDSTHSQVFTPPLTRARLMAPAPTTLKDDASRLQGLREAVKSALLDFFVKHLKVKADVDFAFKEKIGQKVLLVAMSADKDDDIEAAVLAIFDRRASGALSPDHLFNSLIFRKAVHALDSKGPISDDCMSLIQKHLQTLLQSEGAAALRFLWTSKPENQEWLKKIGIQQALKKGDLGERGQVLAKVVNSV
ncbi:MAG: hypothetical protein KVP17_002344 [Porospora cf. gigantea B]|uniref:uncharacterized protein n=1 Tax=Porospora cf. gigantea B TaxID=2853592 RepID=UPI003571BE64|nr:MAG: hypothetical protein KVP17_002344 [Porospora cf. gigantea B]